METPHLERTTDSLEEEEEEEELSCRGTFDPQSDEDALVLEVVDKLAAVPAPILQLHPAELQRGIQDVSLPEGRSPSQRAIGLPGAAVGDDDNVLPPRLLHLHLGPLYVVLARPGPQDAG